MFDIQYMDQGDLDLAASQRIPSLGEFLSAQASDAFHEGTTTGIAAHEADIKANERVASQNRVAKGLSSELPKLSKEEFEASPYFRKGIEWSNDMTEPEAKVRALTYDKSMYRKSIIERSSPGVVNTTLGFGAALVGSIPDPINLIPFGGAASKAFTAGKALARVGARQLAKKGVQKSITTTGAKAAIGVVDGAIGNLATSAVTRPYWEENGIESTWHDYVMDVTMGAVIGGGMGYLGAKVSDYSAARRKVNLKDKDAIARGMEKSVIDLEDGNLPDPSKVEGFQESIDNIWKHNDVARSEHLGILKDDLIKAGFSPEEAQTSLSPLAAHALTYSKHYGLDFNTFLKEKTLTSIENKGADLSKVKEGTTQQITPVEVKRQIDDLINNEVGTLRTEILNDLNNKDSGARVLNQESPFKAQKTIDWGKTLGTKDQGQISKALELKKGPIYQKIKKVAQKRLSSISKGEKPSATQVQYKKLVKQGKTLSHGNVKKKGEVSFYQDGKTIIRLFKDADSSTIIHETGHIFLRNMEELAARGDAPTQIVEDFKIIREWMGLKEGQKINRTAHEKFARGFEAYAREGEAPSQALVKAFETFKDWLRTIYNNAKELNVDLSQDARAVYNRLLGGDGKKVIKTMEGDITPPPGEVLSQSPETGIVDEVWSQFDSGEFKGNDSVYFERANIQLKEIEIEKKLIDKLPEALTLFQKIDERAQFLADELEVDLEVAEDFLRDINITGSHLENVGVKDAALRLANQMMDEAKLKEAQAKKRAALGVMRKRKMHEFIDAFIDNGGTVEDALLASLEGKSDFRNIKGSGSSVYTTFDALRKFYIKDLELRISEIDPDIWTKVKKDPGFTDKITKEMWNLDSNFDAVSGDLHAKQVAKILKTAADDARARLIDTGSDIRYLENWSPQAHDYQEMIRVGREKWVQDVRELIDIKRTFGKNLNPKELDNALAETFNTLVTGFKEDKTVGLDFDRSDEKAFTGNARQQIATKNVSKRHEGAREVHFKNADSQISYNKIYGGSTNAVTGVANYLEKAARTLSLSERLGSNPELTLNLLIADYKEAIKTETLFPKASDNQRRKMITNLPGPGEIGSRGKRVGRALAEAMGETMITENINVSMVSTFIRNIQTVSKLGSATLSQIADVATQVNERFILRDEGLLDAWSDTLGGYFEKVTPEKRDILDRIAVITDGILSDEINRWNAQDNPQGVMKRLNDFQFKWNGMNALTNKTKGSFALSLSKDLGQFQSNKFGDLPDGYKQALKQYGNIDELKWEIIRKAKSIKDDNGKAYLTPDKVREISDSELEALIPTKFQSHNQPMYSTAKKETVNAWENTRKLMLTERRRELELDLRRFFVEETRNAILEPDARTRRYLVQGTRPGTMTGEALRFMMQFKSFSFTAFHRILLPGRMERAGFQSGQIKKNFRDSGIIKGAYDSLPGVGNVDYDLKGIGHYTAMALIVGYMSMTAKDLAKGRTPRSTRKWSTWLEAAAQSGGAGILGDFLFAPSNRYGTSFIGTVAGPTAATVDDIHKIYSKGLTGNPDVRSNSLNLVKQNLPLQSLWWSRAAFDYSVMFHLREAINRGSVRRMERRIKKDADQQYMISPSKLFGY